MEKAPFITNQRVMLIFKKINLIINVLTVITGGLLIFIVVIVNIKHDISLPEIVRIYRTYVILSILIFVLLFIQSKIITPRIKK